MSTFYLPVAGAVVAVGLNGLIVWLCLEAVEIESRQTHG